MARRLRTVSSSTPGWTRRRAGRGFVYLDQSGERVEAEHVERIRALVIPPAWTDVWICPFANGHLQATGVDAAGRRQYLYHPQWRLDRDREKFDRVLRASRRLPALRRIIADDLIADGVSQRRASAVAAQLLDLGCFRVGNDVYADEHGSFGLTTLLRRHVRHRDGALLFSFPGKSGVEHHAVVDDPAVLPTLALMRRRRGGERLLAFKESGRWRDLTAEHVNAYLQEHFRGAFTAKDFRTWHATVIAALALAQSEEPGRSAASRARAMRSAVVQTADYLGNTPAVAKSSYIDPRIWDAYEAGEVIPVPRAADPVLRRQRAERAVRRLLSRS